MKSTELRVGNLVCHNDHHAMFRVLEIDALGIKCINPYEETWIEYDNLNPIFLSDLVFKNFGFKFLKEELGAKFYQIQIGVQFLYVSDMGHWGIVYGKDKFFAMHFNFKMIEGAHELQNLYFALTGNDLGYTE